MTPEDFIKDHPFPENGAEINNLLVRDIQDPSKQHLKQQNLQKLLENNARLIYIVYSQYNYNQSLGSIMSFVYEGLAKATETFDPQVGMPFYHYAVQTIRGLLQNWYNYNNDLIHIPVMKRKDITHEFADVNDYVEHQYLEADSEQDDADYLSSELDNMIIEYEHAGIMTDIAREDLDILKLYRVYTLKEISDRTGINTVRIRKMLDRAINRIKSFDRKFKNEVG